MAELASEIVCDTASEVVRKHVSDTLRSAYSIRSAPAQLLWYLLLIVLPAPRLLAMAQETFQEYHEIIDEARLSELYDLHRASVAAVNPIFGALAYAARAIFRLKTRIYAHPYHTDGARLSALQMKAA